LPDWSHTLEWDIWIPKSPQAKMQYSYDINQATFQHFQSHTFSSSLLFLLPAGFVLLLSLQLALSIQPGYSFTSSSQIPSLTAPAEQGFSLSASLSESPGRQVAPGRQSPGTRSL
jgi:hypothetical protein